MLTHDGRLEIVHMDGTIMMIIFKYKFQLVNYASGSICAFNLAYQETIWQLISYILSFILFAKG